MKQVIYLKFKLLRKFTILVIAYFIYEITVNGILRYVNNAVDIYAIDVQSIVFHFYFDSTIIFALLLTFRPR